MFAFIGLVVSWVWNGIQAIADVTVATLAVVYHALAGFSGAIWDAAKWSYSNILKPIGTWLDKAYKNFEKLYASVLKPIQDYAQRIVKALRLVYATYLQPVLSTIDGVRKTLELLQLLHVQWAQKLDEELAALEQKIAAPLLRAIQVVNDIDSTISKYVLTFDRLFQKATHLNTLRRDVDAVANIQWNRMMRKVPKKGTYKVVGPPEPATVEAVSASLDGILVFDGGSTDPMFDEIDDYFDFGTVA